MPAAASARVYSSTKGSAHPCVRPRDLLADRGGSLPAEAPADQSETTLASRRPGVRLFRAVGFRQELGLELLDEPSQLVEGLLTQFLLGRQWLLEHALTQVETADQFPSFHPLLYPLLYPLL